MNVIDMLNETHLNQKITVKGSERNEKEKIIQFWCFTRSHTNSF